MMQVRQHEQEFMRKRREEMRMSELGETSSSDVKAAPAPKMSREEEIMGDHASEVLLQVGEGDEKSAVPFDAVHVPRSGDIEDGDAHFVMTDKLRHKELKHAVLGESEQLRRVRPACSPRKRNSS